VAGVDDLGRVRLDEGAQVGDQGGGAVRIHAQNPVGVVRVAMGATAPGEQRVERAVQEGDVGDPADLPTEGGGRLVRGEPVGDGGARAGRVDLRDAGGVAAGV